MVVFVDLDQDAFTEYSGGSAGKPFPSKLTVAPIATAAASAEFLPSPTSPDEDRDRNCEADIPSTSTTDEDPVNPNRNAFSAALSCYPYVEI